MIDQEPNPTETESNSDTDVISSADGTDSAEPNPSDAVMFAAGKATDYPTDESLGYTLTQASMSPGSYAAHFSAALSNKAISYPTSSGFMVLYTTDETLAAGFFPQVSHIAQSDVYNTGFTAVSLRNAKLQMKSYENSLYYYDLEGDFLPASGTPLKPNTTYYYRIVYLSASKYYFLTAPGQFTTAPPVETSAVKITSIEAESVGYNSAKIVWTVENPNQEYIFNQQLESMDLSFSYSAYAYSDENGNSIPGKYYAIARPSGRTLLPKLTVYTGESTRTVITASEPLSVEPADFSQATITASVQASVNTANVQIQITPWHQNDMLYAKLFYRVSGETGWKSRPFIISAYADTATHTETLSDLSAETNYEYYVTLHTSYNAADSIAHIASDTEPLTFSTGAMEAYEDSLFPDAVFRNWIKQQMGIAADAAITNETASRLTSLNWYWREGDDVIRSLEGIQYLTNLSSISINYHEIDEMPDLSALSNLQTVSLAGNKIASGITAEKLPAAFLEANPSWLSATAKAQRLPAKTPTQAE
ncbi:MAG: hypothetical protein NC092_09350, partial [Butyrivibrio sp.]|nr:hypothetical protein [Butyrivibrio sp.]